MPFIVEENDIRVGYKFAEERAHLVEHVDSIEHLIVAMAICGDSSREIAVVAGTSRQCVLHRLKRFDVHSPHLLTNPHRPRDWRTVMRRR